MKVDLTELVSATDIARMLNVQASAISNWRQRNVGFPEPVTTVANGHTPLWIRSDVLAWHRERLGPEGVKRELERAQAIIDALKED